MSSPITDAVIAAIAEQCPDVTVEHVALVLQAWNAVIDGEPVGTILKDPVTGNLAVRVSENGVHQWKITAPNGGMWSDLQPTFGGWEQLA